MTKTNFEHLLDVCCGTLTHEARRDVFKTAQQFENRVREVLDDLLHDEHGLRVDFSPPPQAFPDIALGEYGVEVKFTLADTWKSIANSIQEAQRVQDVRYIYIVFGKMGGTPEVRWGSYERSIVHVRTSHVPRFEVELPAQGVNGRASLFDLMGVSYEDFSRMDIHEKNATRSGVCKKDPSKRTSLVDGGRRGTFVANQHSIVHESLFGEKSATSCGGIAFVSRHFEIGAYAEQIR